MAWISVLASVLLLYAGCGSETLHAIDRSGLVGSWKTSGGDSIRFFADREVRTNGFSDSGEESCGDGGVGRWSFYVVMDDRGESLETSPEATEGSLISVRLREDAEGECHVDLSVIDEGRSLCVADIDNVCATGARFTRQ
ncbi:hypothetical protein [Streptomyces sp. Cmuel-A718b]|uniref:hypothetical protein n=1 Tax=Streptomyces sp. Cmuel-A718b TaxID=697328 RepID=UPI00081D373D|nr:hypothetical protein [Streptomyces sp. Cmuel-A718b]SCF72270.1 hypothetical protein GA0115280_108712 [Streptomyces sp. Cmuel-A718b]